MTLTQHEAACALNTLVECSTENTDLRQAIQACRNTPSPLGCRLQLCILLPPEEINHADSCSMAAREHLRGFLLLGNIFNLIMNLKVARARRRSKDCFSGVYGNIQSATKAGFAVNKRCCHLLQINSPRPVWLSAAQSQLHLFPHAPRVHSGPELWKRL